MSAFALVSGALRSDPQIRTAKTGRSFATCQIITRDGADSELWNVITFDAESVSELARLRKGDSIAAQGQLRLETYEAKDGAKKLSCGLTASSILPLRRSPKKRRDEAAETSSQDTRTRQERQRGHWSGEAGGPNDPLDLEVW
jgi:single-stranded DNA-binding protein